VYGKEVVKHRCRRGADAYLDIPNRRLSIQNRIIKHSAIKCNIRVTKNEKSIITVVWLFPIFSNKER
jgi:hypothetical protein